jgi:hypothetical protein
MSGPKYPTEFKDNYPYGKLSIKISFGSEKESQKSLLQG